MARRHLPFASIDARQRLNDYDKGKLDRRLFDAAIQGHLPEVAQALQLGADINFRMDCTSGVSRTALEVCVLKWMKEIAEEPLFMSTRNHVTEFLLLYEETYIPFSFDGTCTILHLCMAIGATTDFMRPFCGWSQDIEELQICDVFDKTITSVANRCSLTGRVALMRLRLAYAKNSQLDTFLSNCYGLAYDDALGSFRVNDYRRFRLQEEAEHRFASAGPQQEHVNINGYYGGGHTCGCQLCNQPITCRSCRESHSGRSRLCLSLIDPLLSERRPSSKQSSPRSPRVADQVVCDTQPEQTQLDTSCSLNRSVSCNEQAEPRSHSTMPLDFEFKRNTVG